ESIIEPLIGGLSGLILAGLIHFLGFGAGGVIAIVTVLAVAWFALVLVQDGFYRQALRTAMYARRFGSSELAVDDPEAVTAVRESLESPIAGRVLNALNLADQMEGF